MLGEVGAIAVVAPGAKEKDLDAGLTGLLGGGDDIGVLDTLDIDVLMSLNVGHGANSVAESRSRLKVEACGGLFHLLGEVFLHLLGTAG